MRRPQVLILLLILASVLVDVVVLFTGGGPDLLEVALFTQVNLISIWLCLGRTPGPLRVTVLLAVIVTGSWLRTSLDYPHSLSQSAIFLVAQAVVTVVPGWIARLLGLHVWNVAELEAPACSPPRRRRWQFSILQLLGWTAAVAIVLGTLKSLDVDSPDVYRLFWSESDAVLLIGHAAIAWATAWGALGQGNPRLRRTVILVTTAVALGGWIMADIFGAIYYAVIYVILVAVLMLASLGMVRVAGYRVEFCRARTVPDAKAAAETP